MTEADLEYISSNYLTLEQLSEGRAESPDELRSLIAARKLPEPSYVLPDGTGMFPADYFRLVDEAGGVDGLREHLAARHRAADGKDVDQDWEMYLDGTWGICLNDVTPETIVRKNTLVASLSELLMLPRPDSEDWRVSLREQVDELGALERGFTPDWDRGEAQERPPTRDLLLTE